MWLLCVSRCEVYSIECEKILSVLCGVILCIECEDVLHVNCCVISRFVREETSCSEHMAMLHMQFDEVRDVVR